MRDSAGEWPHGWQCNAMRFQTRYYRDRVSMPALLPSAQALLRSQAGPQAGMWLTAIPAEAATTLPPQAMLVALRRRLRLALPLLAPTHVVVAQWTPLATTPLRVQERACWPDVPKSWSAPGSEWRGKPWGRKARSCHNSGSPPRLLLVCSHRTADAWTSSCMGLQLVVARFAATRPWYPLLQGRVTLSPAPSKLMGPPSRLQSVASRQPTPSSHAEARRHCWCWGLNSAVDGAPGPGADLVNARLPPSGAPQRTYGRDDGGAPYQWRCSSRLQALGRSWPAAAQPCSDGGPTLDRVLDLGVDARPSRLPLRP